MTLFEEFAEDASLILYEIGRTIRYRNADVKALVGEQTLGYDLEKGGMVATGSLTVKLLHATYASAPPKDGDHLTFADVKYRVNTVVFRPPSAWFILTCDPYN